MKKGYVVVIPAEGNIRVEQVDPEDLLHELQRLVGGYIEIIDLGEYHAMVVNEEGKLASLPKNPRATKIYDSKSDYIAGDALIIKRVPDDIAAFSNAEYVRYCVVPKYNILDGTES